jgi:hypothetical protein
MNDEPQNNQAEDGMRAAREENRAANFPDLSPEQEIAYLRYLGDDYEEQCAENDPDMSLAGFISIKIAMLEDIAEDNREREAAAARDAILEKIAQKELRIPTLQLRRSDRLDFHDCGVGRLKEALQAAYAAGRAAK